MKAESNFVIEEITRQNKRGESDKITKRIWAREAGDKSDTDGHTRAGTGAPLGGACMDKKRGNFPEVINSTKTKK